MRSACSQALTVIEADPGLLARVCDCKRTSNPTLAVAGARALQTLHPLTSCHRRLNVHFKEPLLSRSHPLHAPLSLSRPETLP
jgi:hypothetical protein